MNLLVDGMLGLGDNIYQTPIIRELARQNQVYLRTPWPQLYRDMGKNLHLGRVETKLRTQGKNQLKNPIPPCKFPDFYRRIRLSYVPYQRKGVAFYRGLILAAGLNGFDYQLKLRPTCQNRKDYAVIRPATFRQEWKALSRNPKPEYIQFAIDQLEKKGIETIVVADIDPPHEVYDGPRPNASRYYEFGELGLEEMIELIYRARVVVGGVGFIVPLCIAIGTPAIIIHGGVGGCSAPSLIDAPGEGRPTHVLPESYCLCQSHSHPCNKDLDISKLQLVIDSL